MQVSCGAVRGLSEFLLRKSPIWSLPRHLEIGFAGRALHGMLRCGMATVGVFDAR